MPSTDGPRQWFGRRWGVGRLSRRLRSDHRVRAGAIGLFAGVIAVPLLVLVVGWSPRAAESTTFALGALVLGFAVLAWVAAVMTGPAVESLQTYMDLADGWTAAEARLAFAILSALGLGVMVGSSIASILV